MARILLVEDDQTILEAYGLAIKQAGLEVDLAKNGIEAMAAIDHQEPDIILLDLLMPEMNGVEFLKAFDPSKHPETIILVFTNMAAESTVEAVRAMGVTHYLTKAHYTPSDILRLVQGLLD